MRLSGLIVASLVALALAGQASAERVSVLVVPTFDPGAFARRGAVGLFVPGAGERVSRQAALASLLRGKTENSVTGGVPGGQPLIALGKKREPVTIYVALPPPGWHANDRRYPIAIVGGGYQGLLTSASTRIPGLVSIADIAPTARDLEHGEQPRIRWRAATDARAAVAVLDRRIERSQNARLGATLIVVLAVLLTTLAAAALHSCYLARVAVLTVPAVLAVSLLLSALGVTEPGLVLVLLAALTAAVCLAAAASARLLPFWILALVVTYLVVFVAWPETSALAVVGSHVDGGGRFYGATNLIETILLSTSLLAAGLLGLPWVAPVAALAIVTVGWSRAGADGGGLVVFLGAFLTLALVLARARLSPRALALATSGAAALVLALVGLDAATGGSSHVTRAVDEGPGALAGDLGHRIHISTATLTSSWQTAIVVAISLTALVVLALRGPLSAVRSALLVGIAISLLVNDSPSDIAAAGALSFAAIWVFERQCRPGYLTGRRGPIASQG